MSDLGVGTLLPVMTLQTFCRFPASPLQLSKERYLRSHTRASSHALPSLQEESSSPQEWGENLSTCAAGSSPTGGSFAPAQWIALLAAENTSILSPLGSSCQLCMLLQLS